MQPERPWEPPEPGRYTLIEAEPKLSRGLILGPIKQTGGIPKGQWKKVRLGSIIAAKQIGSLWNEL